MSQSRICLTLSITLLLASAMPAPAQTVAAKQDEAKLIATVQSPDASQKAKIDACRQLAIVGGEDSIAPLAALLGDEKLSHMARYALEPNPSPAVDVALRNALGQLQGGPLVGVIGSLGVRRDAEAVPALAKRLNDSDAVVARAAARALGSIGTPDAARALQGALPSVPAGNKLDVCEGLFRCAERLCATGQEKEALPIVDLLRKSDAPHQVRGGALRYAILGRGKEGVALLKESLRSRDYILFSAAVQTSYAMPDRDVTQALVDGMEGLPADHQVLVVQALGHRADEAALTALLAAAQTGPGPVRVAAIRAAVEIGDASAVPILVRLLDDADGGIAQAAREGLAALPGKEADDAVIAMFGSGNARTQSTALELMARRRMNDAVPVLLKAARAGDPGIRPAAIKAVGDLGGPEQLSALLDLLKDLQRPQELTAAEQALAAVCTKADDPQAQVRKILGRLEGAEPAQKASLLRVLSAVGGAEALQAVRTAVRSDNAQVRAAAVRALGAWRTADAAPHLLALAQEAQDPSERTLFLRSYLDMAGRGDLAVEQRLEMCKQAGGLIRSDDEKKLLLGTLSGIDVPEALALVVPYLNEPRVQQEAGTAVVALAERMLRGRNTRNAGPLIEPLEKVTQVAKNEALVKRAQTLLERARSRAGNRQ
jgi:HEAT repeat protein